MGLGGVSKLLSGFTAVAHYDTTLWAAAVGDASTWMGAHVGVPGCVYGRVYLCVRAYICVCACVYV